MGWHRVCWGLLAAAAVYACSGVGVDGVSPMLSAGAGGQGAVGTHAAGQGAVGTLAPGEGGVGAGTGDAGAGNVCGFSNIGGGSDGPHVNDPYCGPAVLPDSIDHQVMGTMGALKCVDSFADAGTCGMFEYVDAEVLLYLFFEPALAKSNITEPSLRANFSRLWYSVTPPNQPGPKPVSSDRIDVEDLNGVDAFAFADGRLHVKLSTSGATFTRWIEPKCACGDTDVGPDTCRCDYPVSLPITQDLDLIFPTL